MPPSVWQSLRQRLDSRGTPPTVAMLHSGRVGSTVLGTMLGDRDDCRWDGEPFEPSSSRRVAEFEQGRPPSEVVALRRAATPDTAYVLAVKYLWSHHLRVLELTLPALVEALSDGGVDHWVLVHRRNHLRRVVSGAVGRARGSYHQRSSDGPADLVTVRLDPQDVPFGPGAPLLDVFAELDRGRSELQRLLTDSRALWLTYEDDIEHDPTVAYRRVCDFLGLPAQEVDVRLRRTTPFPLSQVIENHDEIATLLRGTPHEWMLAPDA